MRRLLILLGLLAAIGDAGCAGGPAAIGGASRSWAPSCGHGAVTVINGPLALWSSRSVAPAALHTPLPSDILSNYALLRRAPTPADELPLELAGIAGELARHYELSSFWPGYVRRLGVSRAGLRYFVVPAVARPEAPLPANCQSAAHRRRLVQRGGRQPPRPVYCVLTVSAAQHMGVDGCEFFAPAYRGGAVFDAIDISRREPVVQLVPDRVASLRISYRETASLSAHVHDNAVLYVPPSPSARVRRELDRVERQMQRGQPSVFAQPSWIARWNATVGETQPTKIEWLNSAGAVEHTTTASASGGPAVARTPIEGG
jgi:hypothetical protein